MDDDDKHYDKSGNNKAWWRTSWGMVAIFFAILAGYSLFKEHAVHFGGWLIWAIIILCPLVHIFMHRGHGHRHHKDSDNKDDEEEK